MILPTDEDLKPLYDAALAYGKASVEYMRIYGQFIDELGDHKLAAKTKKVRASGDESRRLYQIMDAARTVVNDKFPGLNLFCPAPHVGWTGEIESYRESVRSAIESHVCRQWSEQNEGEITELREMIASLPVVQANKFNTGDLVYSTVSIFRVTKVSTKRAKVEAENLLTGQVVRLTDKGSSFPEGYKRINKPLCDRVMALYRSRQLAVGEIARSVIS